MIPKILKSLDGLEGTSSYGAAYDLATFMDDIVGEEHTASQKRWFGTGETFDKYDEPLVWGYVDGGGIYLSGSCLRSIRVDLHHLQVLAKYDQASEHGH